MNTCALIFPWTFALSCLFFGCVPGSRPAGVLDGSVRGKPFENSVLSSATVHIAARVCEGPHRPEPAPPLGPGLATGPLDDGQAFLFFLFFLPHFLDKFIKYKINLMKPSFWLVFCSEHYNHTLLDLSGKVFSESHSSTARVMKLPCSPTDPLLHRAEPH